jgi:ATP-dependent helicase/nuclease subunit B
MAGRARGAGWKACASSISCCVDRALRPGLEPIAGGEGAGPALSGPVRWWDEAEALLAPLLPGDGALPLGAALALLAETAEALCGEGIWAQSDGRCLSQFVGNGAMRRRRWWLETDPADLPVLLRDALDEWRCARPMAASAPRSMACSKRG